MCSEGEADVKEKQKRECSTCMMEEKASSSFGGPGEIGCSDDMEGVGAEHQQWDGGDIRFHK